MGQPKLIQYDEYGMTGYIYLFIFSDLYEKKIKKNSRIKMIDKLTTKANPKRHKYHHPKEFS